MLLLVAFRSLALSILIFITDYFLNLGTSPFLLALSCSAGVLAGATLAKSRLNSAGFILLLLTLCCFYYLTLKFLEFFALSFFTDPLRLYSLFLHSSLALIALSAGMLSTWGVMRSVHGLSAEVLTIVFGTVYFFAGHRDFNFQSPQILGSIAWSLGYSPLAVLSASGVLLIGLTLVYLRICGNLHEQRLALSYHQDSPSLRVRSKSALSILCIIGLFALIGNSIFSRYQTEAEIRTSNGVGQGKETNQSPLGFNSALGASNQPAALVRLDGDYTDNPFIPMLYLRESALSKYNGIEMVAAEDIYDREVSSVAPGANYRLEQQPDWEYRTPLVQSVFLLADHKLSFAVDYPVSINPLKNPNPARFKAAFKTYSMAPAFSQDSLKELEVGDPAWDTQTKEHYLQQNPDKRYAELARKITADLNSPVEKAFMLSRWISDTAIYTLSPGHDTPQNGDQTAPFLFGDMRGYCVHFAHAMAYLLRSLGIPARVATGYLTDLSESRDGHILLRMSDRHAWAEVYIRNRGWIPFDPKPQRVESHAESPVDMKLLEELMGLVGPDEEILPPDLTQGEAGLVEPDLWNIPGAQILATPLLLIIALFFVLKTHLWFAWILPCGRNVKLKRFYRALAARFNDLGIARKTGETREEYRGRVSAALGYDLLKITAPLNKSIYSGSSGAEDLSTLYHCDIVKLAKIPFAKKLRALLNPASILRYLSRSGW